MCKGELERLISAPAIQFKGSGWYVNDYAGKGGSKSSATGSDAGSSDKKESSKPGSSDNAGKSGTDSSSSGNNSGPSSGAGPTATTSKSE